MDVYIVTHPEGDRLILEKGPKAAINFVIGNNYTARKVTASELVDLLDDGMTVETGNQEPSEPEEEEEAQTIEEKEPVGPDSDY